MLKAVITQPRSGIFMVSVEYRKDDNTTDFSRPIIQLPMLDYDHAKDVVKAINQTR